MILGRALIFSLLALAAGAPSAFAANDAASVGRFEVHADASVPARTISFGQIFLPGTVQRGDNLQALLDGHAAKTQVDPKAFNADGSVRHAILTIELPQMSSGQKFDASIAKAPGAPADPVPAGAAPIPALDVIVGLKGANGAVHNIDVNL